MTSDRWQTRLLESRHPKVIVPFTNLQPLAARLLGTYGLNPRFVPVHGDGAYRLLMREIWEEGDTVIIIEHDILPWPGAIEELLLCQCVWGGYTYQTNGGLGVSHMLGCAKLDQDLIAHTPGLWDEPAHWSQLDQRLLFAARSKGIEPHLHRPPVIHINPRELNDGT